VLDGTLQGNDLLLGNVGDSRAVLGTVGDDGSLMAIQLTVDLKPDLPSKYLRHSFCLLNHFLVPLMVGYTHTCILTHVHLTQLFR
jgi:hypothetical protein